MTTESRGEVVARSLELGEHRDGSHSMLRAILGLGMILFGTARPVLRHALGRQVFVVNNPVAHGVRFAKAFADCLEDGDVLADSSLAAPDLPITCCVSSLGVRSIGRVASSRRLVAAVRQWQTLDSSVRRSIAPGRLEALYLYIAQSMRFAEAEDLLGHPSSRAELVVTDFDRGSFAAPWMEAARKHGLPTVTLVHGSPRASTYLPLRASSVFVWGEVQREWFEARVPEARVFPVGRPDMAEDDALDGAPRRLFICHSRESLSPGESDRLLSLAEGAQGTYQTVLRVHPSIRLTDLENGWPVVADACDRVEHGDGSLPSELRADDVVAVVSSTAAIEALALLVLPVVLADPDRELPADLEDLVAAGFSSTGVLSHGILRSELRDLRRRVIVDRGDRSVQRVRNALDEVLDAHQ